MKSSSPYPASLAAAIRSIWMHRQLILELTKRDVIGRYRGSFMGLAWSFVNPLVMLVVYTFVFSVVFKARWGTSTGESHVDFALVLFVGLIVHGIFAESVQRAPGLVLSNVNYVKKIVFPLEILPVVAVCATLFHSAISLCVLLLGMLVTGTALHPGVLLLPIVIAPLAIAMLGLSWILASLGVFLRDIQQTMGIVSTVLMFLSPIFYPASSLPASFQNLLALNPLTFVIEQSRAVSFLASPVNWIGWLIYLACATMTAALGFWWFQRTRRGFADVV